MNTSARSREAAAVRGEAGARRHRGAGTARAGARARGRPGEMIAR